MEPAGRAKLGEAARRALAWRYRPCLVLFPEDDALGPPYRADELAHLAGADYHPRPVQIFLDQVRLRQGRTQWLPDLPDLTPPREIRASAQGFIALITYGVGIGLGSILSGNVVEAFTVNGVKDWKTIWWIPCILAAAISLLFALAFKDKAVEKEVAVEAQAAVKEA